MTGEIDVGGVFVPALLVWLLAALLICAGLRRLLERVGLYRLVWHRALFDLALLVIVLGGIVALTSRWIV